MKPAAACQPGLFATVTKLLVHGTAFEPIQQDRKRMQIARLCSCATEDIFICQSTGFVTVVSYRRVLSQSHDSPIEAGDPFLILQSARSRAQPNQIKSNQTQAMLRLPLLLLASLGVASVSSYQTNVIFNFEETTSGAHGRILVDFDPELKSNEATFSVNLNFNKVDLAALAKADVNCKGKPTEYTWHIHSKWESHDAGAGSFGQCSKALTANHYDPYRSCGPASDYVDAPECAGRVKNYKCNPENYKVDPWLCEVGDLSGKFGRLQPDHNGDVSMSWVDTNFPTWHYTSPAWSIVIHAVCGTATPRAACAYGSMLSHKKKIKAVQGTKDVEDESSESKEEQEQEQKQVKEIHAGKNLRIKVSVKKSN